MCKKWNVILTGLNVGGFHFVWRNLGTVTMDLVTYKEYGSTCGKLFCSILKQVTNVKNWRNTMREHGIQPMKSNGSRDGLTNWWWLHYDKCYSKLHWKPHILDIYFYVYILWFMLNQCPCWSSVLVVFKVRKLVTLYLIFICSIPDSRDGDKLERRYMSGWSQMVSHTCEYVHILSGLFH